MKKSVLILVCLALVFSLCCVGAAAADDQTLSDLTFESEYGELGVDWVPDSLGDDPNDEDYDNIYDPADYVERDEYYSESGFNYDTDTWELADDLQPEDTAGSSGEQPTEDTLLLALEGGGYIEYARRENESLTTAETSHYYNPLSDSIPIYNQTGSVCWSIAATTCMQLASLQKGIFTTAPSLSVDHLVYFAYHGFTDSLCNPSRDYITPTTQLGNAYASVMTLASWAGAVSESSYTAGDDVNDHDIYGDDILHLRNASWLSLSGSNDRAAVKQAVLDYGGAAVNMYTSSYLGKSGSSQYYNAENCCYCYYGTTTYTSGGTVVNRSNDHEVVIVGWDDDYPGGNFPTPPTNDNDEILNGAWLCRNSWGDEWGEDGYFWLSYYDTMLCARSVVAVFDPVSAETDYDNIYQYDCNYTLTSQATANVSSATIANVFTAAAAKKTGDSELLKAVSTYTLAPGIGYKITVFTDLTEDDDPRSGTAAATLEGTFDYAGYHTLALEAPVYLTEGSKYSVVVQLKFNGSSGNKIPTCSTTSTTHYSAINSSSAGESFMLYTTGWHDRVAEKSNFRIKAFTDLDTCNHDWGKESVVTEATCTEDGLARYVCADCGAVKMAAIPAGHSIEHVEALEPERIVAGNIEHWRCTVCGQCYADEKLARELTDKDVYIAPLGFEDVDEKHYAHDAVIWAVEEGITTGVSEDNFGPDKVCNRAQIVTFLWRYNGCPEPTISECPFTDVKTSNYYYKAVLWAVEKGITTGTDATHFSPTKNCSRADVVTFLWRSAGKPEPTSTATGFTDLGSKSSYYYKAVLWAVEKGITTGIDKTQFKPGNPCKRVQAVTFLSRLAKLS